MKRVIAYLLVYLIAIAAMFLLDLAGKFPAWIDSARLPLQCGLLGGVGGCLYCLRGVYLNACVRKDWDDLWQPWYYIRPVASTICGVISYVFLLAGLLVLESSQNPDSTHLGFYALAFVAGLNVDKFVTKIEDVAHATWGIRRSRTTESSSESQAPD
jgi:hypothetical protein